MGSAYLASDGQESFENLTKKECDIPTKPLEAP